MGEVAGPAGEAGVGGGRDDGELLCGGGSGKADGAAASFVVVAELGEGGEADARGDVEELEGAAAKQPVGTRDEELCCGRRRR